MFLFGVVVFGVSSAAIGFAPTDTTLVAFRRSRASARRS